MIEHTNYALAIIPRLLAFFEHYFGIPYPLTKLGMCQVAGDGSENSTIIS
jgi:aminopeptidase N